MATKKKPKRRLRFLPKRKKNGQQVRRTNPRKKKKKGGRDYTRLKIIILCFFIMIFGMLGIANRKRIRLMIKGYSFHDAGLLIKSKNGDITDYLKLDETINMEDWEEVENEGHFYDYYLLKKIMKDEAAVVTYIDGFYDIYPELEELGYDMDTCRKFMDSVSVSEFRLLADKEIEYEDAKEYIDIDYCVIRDIEEYIESGEDNPEDAILKVSYPQIDSRKEADRTYIINNPEQSKSVLVKEGFKLKQNYEPKDLVEVDILYAYDTPTPKLRKEAAKALEKMAKAAEKKELYLAVKSSYRSYDDQDELYNAYIKEYGYAYTKQYCSVPGYSEHQMGVSVDLTSLSVLNGYYGTFGETDEYEWCVKNAYKYGFILRYPEKDSDLTGTANEPWHFRYVGKEIAEEMHEDKMTLEEYILENGFDYALTIQS